MCDEILKHKDKAGVKILIFMNSKRGCDFLGVYMTQYLPTIGTFFIVSCSHFFIELMVENSTRDHLFLLFLMILFSKGQFQMHDNSW